MRENDFTVRGRQSSENFPIVIGDVSAYFYVILGLPVSTDSHLERKKLLRKSFVMEKVEISPAFIFV